MQEAVDKAMAEVDLLPSEEAGQLREIMKGLNPRQIRFVAEYMIDLNASQAAKRCGYTNSQAQVTGCLILANPLVREAVDKLLDIRVRHHVMVRDRMLVELHELAHFDKNEIMAEDGSILPMKDWPLIARQALIGFDVEELWSGRGEDRIQIGEIKKPRFINPMQPYDLLAKHLGIGRDPTPSTNINIQQNTQVNIQAVTNIDAGAVPTEQLEMAISLGLAKLNGKVLELTQEE